MPIQFRCGACRRKLSISRRKAGALVDCPACGAELRVPGTAAVPAGSSPPDAAHAEGGGWPEPEAVDEQHVGPRLLEEADEEGFRLTRRVREDETLDMTPMVDVTFLLLIFFMITASFSLQKSLETEAPDEEQEGFAQLPHIEDLADESVIVEIDENDSIFVDDQRVSGAGELQDVLMRKMSVEHKREMIIEAHYQAKHGTVVAVTDAGLEVGMQRIRRVAQSGR